jgi:ribonuclease G
MTKELIVSSNSHESSVALLEDDQLVELYIARGVQHGLAGSIYKGRVTRVLPGMQSAFVNIGLDRDAFLYVSDFVGELEDMDEGGADAAVKAIEKAAAKAVEVVAELDEPEAAESREPREHAAPGSPAAPAAPAAPARAGQRDRDRGREPGREPGTEGDREAAGDRDGRRDRRGRRSRRRRGRGGQFPDAKYARVNDAPQAEPASAEVRRPEPEDRRPDAAVDDDEQFTVLPGESLAKYSGPSGQRAGSGIEPRDSDRESWSDDATDDGDSLEASAGDREPRGELRRPGIAGQRDDDDSSSRFGRGRSRPEYERALAGDDEDAGEAFETLAADDASGVASAEDAPYTEDDEAELGVAELSAGEDNGAGAVIEEPGSELGASADEDMDEDAEEGAEEDAEEDDDNGEDEQQQLDASEADEVNEAIRDAIGDEDTEEDDDNGEEPGQPEGSVAARGPNGNEEGAREASVRGRGSSSRYVHRRGGRRGRRRGRARGVQEPVEAESPATEPVQSAGTSITDLLNPGQEILVQISKEPLGKKGARITSHIAMPGRYLVYMPTVEHVGVSRKIANDNERLRLRKIVQSHRTGMPGGFIVRTAGSGATEEEIRGDMLFLYNLWLDIRQKAEQRPAPSLIHQDLDIVERVLRDQLGSSFKTMWVDSEGEYERILRFVERFQPELLSRVKLYTRSKPIFDAFNITPEIEKALRPKVWLKSGGYIVINQTEALVAIDVNTGKFVGKSDRLEDTIVKTNVEAVQEIVRQIRLRDLGGIIVVDFIDMDDRKNRIKVAQALDQELRLDRAPSKSLQFNEFGLVAITRKRVKQSLERTLCTPCPYCTGSGFVKSIESVIIEILNEAKKMAPKVRSRKDLSIRVNPEIARALKSRDNSYLQEIEEIFRANVMVRGDVSLHREHFDIN